MSNLLKKVVKDSFAELMASLPSQQVPQHKENEGEHVLPGPSTSEATLPAVDPYTKTPVDQDPSGDSSDEADTTGFSFSLVQPYVQVVKQAISWEEPEEPHKITRSYFAFLGKCLSFFPLMEEVKDLIQEEWKKTKKRFPVNQLSKL